MKSKLLFIVAALSLTTAAFAQIPNNSFENWTTVGSYSDPNSWSTLNATTNPLSIYTCTKGTGGASGGGSAYLKLISKTVLTAVVPAVATTGTINTTSYTVNGGFAYATRPQKLTGSWQYMAYGGDQGFISVVLSKWNTTTNKRDTVAVAYNALPGMAMSWATFNISLIYLNGNNPDTAQIILSASGANGISPVNNSYLYVDNMSFIGSVVGIENANHNISQFNLFPNPATDLINVNISFAKPSDLKIQLVDFTGKLVKEINAGQVKNNFKTCISTSELAKGIYFLKVISGTSTEIKKVIIE